MSRRSKPGRGRAERTALGDGLEAGDGPDAPTARADRRLVWLGVPLALLLFRRALTGQGTLVGADLFLFNLPQLEALARAWRSGHVPGWGAALGLGQPFLADPCIAPHYPGHAVVLVAPAVTALALLLAAHVVLAHAGVYRLARRLRCSPPAAALAGLVFAGGGVMASYVHVPSMLLGGAWMPWAVVATCRAVEPGAPLRRLVVAAGVFAMIYLCGVPEVAALSGALAWGVAVGGAPERARAGLAGGARARAVRATSGLAAIAVLALVMSASTLVPFVLSFRDTNRAGGLDYAIAGTWSLHPLELLGLVVPQPFSAGGVAATLLGHEQRTWNHGLHLGAAGAALALLGLAAARRDRRARVLACVAAPLLVYALGRWGGLHPLLYELVPPIRSFRYPAKAFLAVTLCLSLLAAVGVDHARRAPRPLVFLLVGLVDGLAVLGALSGGMLPLAHRAGLAAVAAVVTGWGVLRGRWRLVLVVALTELVLLGRWTFDVVPAEIYETPPTFARSLAFAEGAGGGPPRVATTRRAGDVRGVAAAGLPAGAITQRGWRDALIPNTGLGLGLRACFGFSSFIPARVVALRDALASTSLPRFYRSFGASHLVHVHDEGLGPSDVAPVQSFGPWVLGALVDAPPWAAVYARPHRAADLDDAAARVADPGFDPAAACVVEGLDPSPPDSGAPARAGRARPRSVSDDRLVLEVDAAADGVLVVREGWGSGWTATVDGRPAPVLPADVVFRAVPVPQGRHEVVLEYEAPGRRVGAAIALLGFALLAGALVLERRASA